MLHPKIRRVYNRFLAHPSMLAPRWQTAADPLPALPREATRDVYGAFGRRVLSAFLARTGLALSSAVLPTMETEGFLAEVL